MPKRLEKIVSYMADAMVEYPDEVRVHAVEGDASLLVELRVDPDDLDSFIGDERRVLRAMQQVVAVSSRQRHLRPVLDLVEDDDGEEEE